MNKPRIFYASIFVGITALQACGGGSGSTSTEIPADQASTVRIFSPLAEVQLLEVGTSNLKFHIDPLAEALPSTQEILDVIRKTEKFFDYKPGTEVMLFTSSPESVDWVVQKAQELDCLSGITAEEIFSGVIGIGGACGLAMMVDAEFPECDGRVYCRRGPSLAVHELYHTVFYQKVESCNCMYLPNGRLTPMWVNEGLADYVGYALIYGNDPENTEAVLTDMKDLATRFEVDVSLTKLEGLWLTGGPYSYQRSYFAIMFLVEMFGEKKVFVEFIDEMITSGGYVAAFEKVFGISESTFDELFQKWMKDPSLATVVTPKATLPPSRPEPNGLSAELQTTVATGTGAIFTGYLTKYDPIAGQTLFLTIQTNRGQEQVLVTSTTTDEAGLFSLELPIELYLESSNKPDNNYCVSIDTNGNGTFEFDIDETYNCAYGTDVKQGETHVVSNPDFFR